MNQGVAWNTTDEIKFYRSLCERDRQGYRDAIKSRKNWGRIDPKALNKAIWEIDAGREIPQL